MNSPQGRKGVSPPSSSVFPKFDLREEALLNLSGCQYALAQKGDAEKYAASAATFATLAKDFPTGRHADQAIYFEGESLFRQDKKPEAVAAYAKLIEKFPESQCRADGLYALGVTREELGQFAEAGKDYELFLNEFGTHEYATEVKMRKGETVLRAGLAAEMAGKADDAANLFAEAAAIFDESAKAKDFRAADHALMRQPFAALKQGQARRSRGTLCGTADEVRTVDLHLQSRDFRGSNLLSRW